MIRAYIALGLCIALVASHGVAYHKGKQAERNKATASALEFREKEQKLIAALDKAKQKREVIYRDKIKIVKEANDACLDTPLPDAVLGVLRSLNDPPERGAHSGLSSPKP